MESDPSTKLSAKERRRRYKSNKQKKKPKPPKPHPPAAAVADGGEAAGVGKKKRKARHSKWNPMVWQRKKAKLERVKANMKAAGAAPEEVEAAVAGARQAGKEEVKAKKAMKRLAAACGGGGQGAKQQQQSKPQQQQNQQSQSSTSSSALLASYPFETEYGDCFETPLQAYQDLEPLLRALAARLHPPPIPTAAAKRQLTIYDPFYCQGRVVQLLASLGFEASRVLNRLRDFYKDVAAGSVPEHEVLVTNPPFSGDHKERILAHCLAAGKPWCLLLPNYVANKQYYTEAIAPLVAQGNAPFYIVPSSKYEFDHPEGTGHATSPFFSIWFCHLPDAGVRRVILPWLQQQEEEQRGQRWRVVASVEGLRAQGAAPAWKRPSNKRRKKMKLQLQMQQGQQAVGR